jgi:hypothetical protein
LRTNPEHARAEKAEARRRRTIVVLVVVALVGLAVAWNRLGPYFGHWPQPSEPRKIVVEGQERLVRLSLSRSTTMGGDPPFTVTVCTDGTIVCDVDQLLGWEWKTGQRFTGHVTPNQSKRLHAAFNGSGFLDLRTDFSRQDSTDHCWYEVYWFDDVHWNLVRHYGGDKSAPRALNMLEWEVQDTLDVDRWVSPGRRPASRPESSEAR